MNFSLVKPFVEAPNYVSNNCIRVFINKSSVGKFHFDEINSRDIFMESYTDNAIWKIVDYYDWRVINILYYIIITNLHE